MQTRQRRTPDRRTRLRTKLNEGRDGLEPIGDGHVPERTCVLTRRKGTKDELIRLALAPDGAVAPDVRARAPGRGAWIGVSRDELDLANAKGKLKSALQRALKSTMITVPSDLGERTEVALRQAVLDRLGMEARAGNLINGSERVETAARSGRVPASHPRLGCGRGWTQASRPGPTRRIATCRRWLRGGDIPRGPHYLVDGTRARKCGTCRADRSRRGFTCIARASPVASFH